MSKRTVRVWSQLRDPLLAMKKWFGVTPVVVSKESLPAAVDPDDDGFDAYRLAAAQAVLDVDGPMVGHIDDNGNLIMRPL